MQTLIIMIELCLNKVIVWACGNNEGAQPPSPPFPKCGGGQDQAPLPPYFSAIVCVSVTTLAATWFILK